MLDCYGLAQQLEREQFEAYQNYASTNEILAIRKKYADKYPSCRWD